MDDVRKKLKKIDVLNVLNIEKTQPEPEIQPPPPIQLTRTDSEKIFIENEEESNESDQEFDLKKDEEEQIKEVKSVERNHQTTRNRLKKFGLQNDFNIGFDLQEWDDVANVEEEVEKEEDENVEEKEEIQKENEEKEEEEEEVMGDDEEEEEEMIEQFQSEHIKNFSLGQKTRKIEWDVLVSQKYKSAKIEGLVVGDDKYCIVTKYQSRKLKSPKFQVFYNDENSASSDALSWKLSLKGSFDEEYPKLHKLFMDPWGHHILIVILTSFSTSSTFYINPEKMSEDSKLVEIHEYKNLIIESVGWMVDVDEEELIAQTKTILFGTRDMKVYATSINCSSSKVSITQPDLILNMENIYKYYGILVDDEGDDEEEREKLPITGVQQIKQQDPKDMLSKYTIIISCKACIMAFQGIEQETLQFLRDQYYVADDDLKSASGQIKEPIIFNLRTTDGEINDDKNDLFIFRSSYDEEDSLAIAFTSGEGIYHGKYTFNPKRLLSQDNISLLKYTKSEVPLGVVICQYHIIVLYESGVHVILQPAELETPQNPDSLLSAVVYENSLDEEEPLKGISFDPVRQTIYVYTDREIFELRIHKKELDMWKIYLDRAMNPKKFMVEKRIKRKRVQVEQVEDTSEFFEKALLLASGQDHSDEESVKREERSAMEKNNQIRILLAQADMLFEQGKMRKAAISYAKTNKPFEEIVLKFVNSDKDANREGLITYLEKMLFRIVHNKNLKQSVDIQKTALITWLVELYINRINYFQALIDKEYIEPHTHEDHKAFEEEKARAIEKKNTAKKKLQDFIQEKGPDKIPGVKNLLFKNRYAIYKILASNGYLREMVFFALEVGDYEYAIKYHITNKRYDYALNILKAHCNKNKSLHEKLWYKYIAIIMKHLPQRTIQTLKRDVAILDYDRIIPALLKYTEQRFDDMFLIKRMGVTQTPRYGQTFALNEGNNSDEASENSDTSKRESIAPTEFPLTVRRSRAFIRRSVQLFPGIKGIDSEKDVINFLKWVIQSQKSMDPNIHNLMVLFLARQTDEKAHGELINFLNTESDDNIYSKEFAFRCCYEYKKYKACVQLFSAMGFNQSAVDFALQYCSNNNVNDAREAVQQIEDPETKRRVILKIVKYLIEKDTRYREKGKEITEGRKEAIDYLKQFRDEINLRDVLQFFPEDSQLNPFLTDIDQALERYKVETQNLENQLRQSTNDAEIIRQKLSQQNQIKIITLETKCHVCNASILAKPNKVLDDDVISGFYVFPCGHNFHVNCLLKQWKSMLDDKLELCGDASLTDIIITAFNHKPKMSLQELRTITALGPDKLREPLHELCNYVTDKGANYFELKPDAAKRSLKTSINEERLQLEKLEKEILTHMRKKNMGTKERIQNEQAKAEALEALSRKIAKQCPFDSELTVDLIGLPFIDYNDEETWNVENKKIVHSHGILSHGESIRKFVL